MLLKVLKKIEVKEMEIDHPNPDVVKWFRFGSYNGLRIASEVIKNLPEKQA